MKSSIDKEKLVDNWYRWYSTIIPCFAVVLLFVLEYKKIISMKLIGDNELFSDMLTGLLTCISIIISIFGFLIPSLISAKNDRVVKYFIENADMSLFVGKIKSVIKSGLVGILLTLLLYLYKEYYSWLLTGLLYLWVWVVFNFACNAYRFISIIIGLLLATKKENPQKECANEMNCKEVDALNDLIPSIDEK